MHPLIHCSPWINLINLPYHNGLGKKFGWLIKNKPLILKPIVKMLTVIVRSEILERIFCDGKNMFIIYFFSIEVGFVDTSDDQIVLLVRITCRGIVFIALEHP